ncbi:MAG: isoprenoid synthase domain-containing protein [Lentinula lateritia]|uniref:Terpene synthase n=1 Tax=Lentinula lateritia TaxID=40482 RepID=A0ABQ8VZX7_9AGAR|nr:MAG: isoprenoid synthase domain-containing protein [Lentinula lateritia]KAJ4500125.1 isoprenoid synthase domain-containing protein [Lentinula lateritia]
MPGIVQYQLPNIDLLLDRQSRPNYKVNPSHPELETEFISFLDKIDHAISPFQRKEIEGAQLPLCAAAYAPDADMPQLRVYLDYFVLLLLVEVMSDVSNAQAGQFDLDYMVNLLNACSDNEPFDTSKQKDTLVHLAAKFARKCFPPLSPLYRYDATQGTILYLQAAAQENHDRKNPSTFTVDSYLAHRRKVVAIHPVIAFNRWMSQVKLSPEILQTPAFEGLLESTIDLIALPNDLISYKKEKAQGEDIHNLVSVAMVDPATPVKSGDIQAALDFAGIKISEAYLRFQQCKLDAIAQTAPGDFETRSEIMRYVDILLETIDGNIVWQIDPRTVRYHVFETPEERAQWLVSICI